MSHITVIISKVAPAGATGEEQETSYEYKIPVPDHATPQQVGELVRKAYRRLETPDE